MLLLTSQNATDLSPSILKRTKLSRVAGEKLAALLVCMQEIVFQTVLKLCGVFLYEVGLN